ncbi:iron-sulfur protein [Nocardioides silvaticus]|uniref:Cytochrome bc1 complex Rieske iron-sulfur subunit n=1 Tax=Nocardioides silvaticus TaxID=2201891 RepID=A0A316TN99_9ACTN|nr:Rieske (2Fe-2S) protein [Nocardioides silvaticus]PWN03742.1 iron-sulfur protein [Nocardioides silvaticus]
MDCLSRRGLISAASVGVTGPLLVVDDAEAGSRALIRTNQVPVGGGVVIRNRRVVVTQPRAGRFRVFSAICTHQGCTVSHVADRRIVCPCHGSRYAITDGAVVAGPAPRPLPRRAFVVRRGRIFLT